MTPAAPAADLTTVFVYGTLMPGESNAKIAQTGGTFTAARACVSGFRLLHLSPEGYPAAIPAQPQDILHGYALTYSPSRWVAALPFLDELEGVDETPPLYSRQQVTLLGPTGAPTGQANRAWIYVYARAERLEQPGVTPVPSGNWRDRPHRAVKNSAG